MYINKRSVAYKEPRGCMELDWTVQSEMVPVSIKKTLNIVTTSEVLLFMRKTSQVTDK